GRITNVNPALALDDERYDASLTGSGIGEVAVQDLLVRSPELKDYQITAEVMLDRSRVRTIALDAATLAATLNDGTLAIDQFHGTGPTIDLQATGQVEFNGDGNAQLDYTIARGDLALIKDFIGREVSGEIVSKGQLTGPLNRVHVKGNGTLSRVESSGLKALS